MITATINLYTFKELEENIQNDVLAQEAQLEAEIVDENSPFFQLAEELNEMQTPWFLASEIYHKHRDMLIETIEVNNYMFNLKGKKIFITENELL